MSRLRRLFLSARFFFLTCRVHRLRRALREDEYNDKAEYIHGNPVTAGLVERPEDWKWSSIHDYEERTDGSSGGGSLIPVDRVEIPGDERTRI